MSKGSEYTKRYHSTPKGRENKRKNNAAYLRRLRETNPVETSRRRQVKYKKLRAKLLPVIQAAKDRPCMDCGVKYPPHVMDFDHKTDKKFLVSRAVAKGVGLWTLNTEISKCEVVCSNCHRERTHKLAQDSPS